MSRKNPTLAEALKVPRFHLTLSPIFVERMARLDVRVTELGKSDGVKAWADDEIRAIMLSQEIRAIMLSQVGKSSAWREASHDAGNGRIGVTYWLDRAGDRAKLAAKYRELARWWLAQGLSIDQARQYVEGA